jgi:radical SAM superfamily enzyme YgiQ (UPF0313 family)
MIKNDVITNLEKIYLKYKSNDFPECKSTILKLLNRKITIVEHLKIILKITLKMNDVRFAQKIVIKLLKLKINEAEINQHLIGFLYNYQYYKLCLFYSKRLIKHFPENEVFAFVFTNSAFRLKKKRLFVNGLTLCNKLKPDDYATMFWLGQYNLDNGKLDIAKKCFLCAQKIVPNSNLVKLRLQRINKQQSENKEEPKFLFINMINPGESRDNDLFQLKELPINLNILMSICEKSKVFYDVLSLNEIIRKNNKIPNKLSRYFKQIKPNVICLSVYEGNIEQVLNFYNAIKDLDIYIILGGPFISQRIQEAISLFDGKNTLLFQGEAENAFGIIINAIKNNDFENKQFNEIPGLYVRLAGKEIVRNIDAQSYLSQDELNSFEINYKIYLQYSSIHNQISICSSRGCPRHCLFCFQHEGKKFRALTASKIIDSIERFYKELQPNIFNDKIIVSFVDNDFFVKKERVEEFIYSFLKKTYSSLFEFQFQASIAALHKHLSLIPELAKLPKVTLTIGTDSFDNEELSRLQKYYTMVEVETVVQALEEAKIENQHYAILSNLDTTPSNLVSQIDNIIYFLEKYEYFDMIFINAFLKPYIGSAAYQRLVERNLLSQVEVTQVTPTFKKIEREYPINTSVRQFLEQLSIPDLANQTKPQKIRYFKNIRDNCQKIML